MELEICRVDSPVLSLRPSDLASQLTMEKAIDNLLECVEPPSLCLCFLLTMILWDYKDCEKDTSQGVIITELNKHQSTMSCAVHCQDGSKVSNHEYKGIWHSADIVVRNLINSANSDPHATMDASMPQTKTFFEKVFKEEYY